MQTPFRQDKYCGGPRRTAHGHDPEPHSTTELEDILISRNVLCISICNLLPFAYVDRKLVDQVLDSLGRTWPRAAVRV